MNSCHSKEHYKFNLSHFLLLLLLTWFSTLYPAADESRDGSNGMMLLPSGSYFRPILLDPASSQLSGSLLGRGIQGEGFDRLYAPINMGFQKMALRYEQTADSGWEAGIEFSVHSQFSIIRTTSAPLGGLDNIDYRIAGVVHRKHGKYTDRLTLWHKSSHLGDDYIIRNSIARPTANTLNYEQLDVMRRTSHSQHNYYYGLGVNISPNTVRERLSAQVGYTFNGSASILTIAHLVGGADLKVFQETDFSPNLKAGVGLEFETSPGQGMTLLLEFYHGHLPYSTLEYLQVNMLGLGVYFRPLN